MAAKSAGPPLEGPSRQAKTGGEGGQAEAKDGAQGKKEEILPPRRKPARRSTISGGLRQGERPLSSGELGRAGFGV